MPRRSAVGAQSAIDFISSYGFVILIIAISVYAVLQLGVFNYTASPQYCYSQYPFTCIGYAVNSSGALAIVLSQDSGGIMNVTGVACSTVPNTVKVGPEYGNVNVLSNSVKPGYYPNGRLASGTVLYPGAQTVLYARCYGGNSGPISSPIGTTFTGYVWVNYTFSGLPAAYHNIGQAATINARYT